MNHLFGLAWWTTKKGGFSPFLLIFPLFHPSLIHSSNLMILILIPIPLLIQNLQPFILLPKKIVVLQIQKCSFLSLSSSFLFLLFLVEFLSELFTSFLPWFFCYPIYVLCSALKALNRLDYEQMVWWKIFHDGISKASE